MCVLKRNKNLQSLEWHDGLLSKHNGSAGRLGAKLIFQNYFKDNSGLFVFFLERRQSEKGLVKQKRFSPKSCSCLPGMLFPCICYLTGSDKFSVFLPVLFSTFWI